MFGYANGWHYLHDVIWKVVMGNSGAVIEAGRNLAKNDVSVVFNWGGDEGISMAVKVC